MFSETRYASNGDLAIAYRVAGEGSRDLVFAGNFFTNVETVPDISQWTCRIYVTAGSVPPALSADGAGAPVK